MLFPGTDSVGDRKIPVQAAGLRFHKLRFFCHYFKTLIGTHHFSLIGFLERWFILISGSGSFYVVGIGADSRPISVNDIASSYTINKCIFWFTFILLKALKVIFAYP
jgi:hypothetical protein